MHPRFARRCEVRASGGSRIRAGSMANVTLKNIKKIYPNADTKKKKKKKEHTSDEPKANLQITDEGVVAVQEFSLDIADREFIVLVGPSGCGKSTTLRMIAGLEEITDGELYIGDRLVNDVAPKDRDIAMVFQNYALYPHMTVYENMAFSLKLKKVPKQEIDKKVREAAEILGITEYLDRKPKALSGGQRQRVAIGRAIVRNPQVLLMDEPLSNLDAKLRVQLRNELKKMQRDFGITTIYVTHDQEEALTLSDRIAVFNKGFIEQIGTPNEVYNHSRTEFVCNFIGDINRLEGEVADGLKLDPAQHHFVRLERIRVNRPADDNELRLDGVIESREYYGLYIKYYIHVGSQTIKAIEKNDGINIYEPGEKVTVGIHPVDVMSYDAAPDAR